MRRALLLAALVSAGAAREGAQASVRPRVGGEAVVVVEGPLTSGGGGQSPADQFMAEATQCHLGDLLERHQREGTTSTFTLRAGLRAQDGAPIQALDLARSWAEADRAGGPGAWRLAVVARGADGRLRVRVLGERRLQVVGAAEAWDPLPLLSHPSLPLRVGPGQAPCGPFRPQARGAGLRLEAVPSAPGGRPFLDALELQVIAPPARPLGGPLPPGELAFTAAAGPGRTPRWEGATAYALSVSGTPQQRAAVGAAIDSEAIATYLFGGAAQALSGWRAGGQGPRPRARPPALVGTFALAFDPQDPAQRRVAEHLQVRLSELGGDRVRVHLGPGAPAGAVPLRLVKVPGLPADPAARLVALLFALGGEERARAALAALRPTESLSAARIRALFREIEALPLVVAPAYEAESGRLERARPGQGPGALWRPREP